jgi:uncharacterized membrane protein
MAGGSRDIQTDKGGSLPAGRGAGDPANGGEEEKSMADLVCVAFDDPTTADRALTELTLLQKEYLIELKDACVVVRSADGEVHLHQSVPLVKAGALTGGSSGALWGALIGLLFLNPLAGMAIGAGLGAASGALAGKLSDYGIPDSFIKELGGQIKPNTSALFLLVQKVTADKVLPRISQFKGRVLKTSLSDEREKRLREALGEAGSGPG